MFIALHKDIGIPISANIGMIPCHCTGTYGCTTGTVRCETITVSFLTINDIIPENLEVTANDLAILRAGLFEPLTLREGLQLLFSWQLPLSCTTLMVPRQTTDCINEIYIPSCIFDYTSYSSTFDNAIFSTNIELIADGPDS